MIRTRFAPSPTGFMHIGGVRTALFAWALAKQSSGVFILRIEDTDQAREVEGSVAHIIESLKWLGIDWQEGPDVGGEYKPYKQSERLDSYHEWAQKLVDKGLAYADPFTPEQVEEFRQQAQSAKKPFLFRDHRPAKTSVPADWYGKVPLRFKVPDIKRYEWHDEVRGDLSAGEEAVDDIIIIKSDGFPTYNFAHIIDDELMQITHVIRGEEFISSMPKYLSIYDALELKRPTFITVPPILNKNGGKKLSKRDGAKDVLEYRDEGYLPEAILNFLASLGWNDGTEQEIFTPEEFLTKFSVERLQKAGAKFDDERLVWISGHHIRRLSVDELYARIDAKFWPEEAGGFDETYKKSVLSLVQERLKFFAEIPSLTWFFFKDPDPNEIKLTDEQKSYLQRTVETLEQSDFGHDDLEKRLRKLSEELNVKPGQLFGAIRQAITGQTVAPGLFETLRVVGKEKTLFRVKLATTKPPQ